MKPNSIYDAWSMLVFFTACRLVPTTNAIPIEALNTITQPAFSISSVPVPLPSIIPPTPITSQIAPIATQLPQICGSRGMSPCPSGKHCVINPLRVKIGLVADMPGTCISLDGPACGGSNGTKCPSPGQNCVNDPRYSCNPYFGGGTTCQGVCVVF